MGDGAWLGWASIAQTDAQYSGEHDNSEQFPQQVGDTFFITFGLLGGIVIFISSASSLNFGKMFVYFPVQKYLVLAYVTVQINFEYTGSGIPNLQRH